MDANLNFLTAPAPNALQIGDNSPASGGKPSAGRSMLGKEFANLMRGLLPDSERQDLAAAGTAASQAGLQTLALGKQFSVITVDAPQPDANSLAAFAKAQGLDDRAVQALFGDLAQLPTPSGLTLGAAPSPSAGITATDPMAWLKDQPTDLMATAAAMTPPSWFAQPPSNPNTAPLTLGLSPVGTVGATGAGNLPLSASVGTSLGAQLSIGAGAATVTATGTAPTTDTLNQLLMASGASATLARFGQVLDTPAGELKPVEGLDLPPEPGPLDAIRMRLMPAWENMTRSLAKATGTDVAFTWASVAAGLLESKANGIPTVDIDLGDTSIGAVTDTGNGAGTVSATFNNDNSAQMNRAADNRPALTLSGQAPATGMGAGERADQISQLADKLGQALSERLQDQMEQGQWKLELRLKPAHLGKISVELDMNAGGLDALFKSDNPLTRELIAQSAPKLRDSLAQAGMAVANVWVNSDGQQQTGGNPTPRQSAAGVTPSGPALSNPAEVKVQAQRAKSTDGWDELV